MTKIEFDKWCNRNLTRLSKEISIKYPRSAPTITEDTSDFYLHTLEKIHEIHSPGSYYYTFIYNRHYRFFSNTKCKRTGHLEFRKNFQIKLTNELPDQAEEEATEYGILDKVLDLVDTLPLDDKILYQLYYVQGLSTRDIGTLHGLSHTGIHKQLKKLENKIKDKLCLEEYY